MNLNGIAKSLISRYQLLLIHEEVKQQ